uniref:Peptidase S1 domain-containing protein n=1 Tax=Corethron hystrix TaxID=216773 RepID=A0A7S1BYS2_9STRA|mmetsp:Transcript_5585/g.11632  ORF Transcript_5585/g.11632 Transcript_5585/m.11632 type:complete len:612 (+) Transcript_5585:121-1956(+)
MAFERFRTTITFAALSIFLILTDRLRGRPEILVQHKLKKRRELRNGLSFGPEDKSARVFNGIATMDRRFPYFAFTEKTAYRCGGVLIADNIILTAAHCEGAFFHVGIGKHSVFDSPSDTYQSVSTSDQIPHPEYAGKPTLDNDFMLVVLKERVTIPPACIADATNEPNVDDPMTVIGFGKTQDSTSVPYLQQAQVHYLQNSECRDRYKNSYLISDNMMCASSDEGKDACDGDSGGPLIKMGSTAAGDVVMGIVSWGIGCGVNPGVYSRISAQRKWIDTVVSRNKGKMCNRDNKQTQDKNGSPILKDISNPMLTPTYVPTYKRMTYNPSNPPSTSPSPALSNTISTSLTPSISSSAENECIDDPTYSMKFLKKDLTCEKISRKPDKYCEISDKNGFLFSDLCKKTCNKCDVTDTDCKDDSSYHFKLYKRVTCAKVSLKPDKYCDLSDKRGNFVSEMCRMSCDKCNSRDGSRPTDPIMSTITHPHNTHASPTNTFRNANKPPNGSTCKINDSTESFKVNGVKMTCDQLDKRSSKLLCKKGCVRSRCPRKCSCKPYKNLDLCQDDNAFSSNDYTCSNVLQSNCKDEVGDGTLIKDHCPKKCDTCKKTSRFRITI